jgi:hypothetical protein
LVRRLVVVGRLALVRRLAVVGRLALVGRLVVVRRLALVRIALDSTYQKISDILIHSYAPKTI